MGILESSQTNTVIPKGTTGGNMQGQQPQAQFNPQYHQPMAGQQMMHQQMAGQPMMVVGNYGRQPSILLSYVLWFFLGFFGVHHLYMGRGIGVWLVSLITFQGLGLWWLLDLFLIPSSCSKIR